MVHKENDCHSHICDPLFSSHSFVCLFDLILNDPSTSVLLKDHNAVMPVRLEPAALRSQVKHSTTEPPFQNINVEN